MAMARSMTELKAVMEICIGKLALIRKMLKAECEYPTRERALEIVKRHEPSFVELAAEVRKLADSWRNFDVGTVLVALRPDATGRLTWYTRFAANTKEEAGEKYCGEQRLMDAALRKGVAHIIAFFVVGEPQADHGSGKKGITLPPCEACRWRMRGLMRETNPMIQVDVLVISANCKMLWARKHQTVGSLHEAHGEAHEIGF